MNFIEQNIHEKSINTIRFLAVDAIQKANSGHPGMPMGCAPIAYLLYSKIMKHNPANPKWINRDRFVLSAGHGSMLLYASLHLSGYNISLEDLKNFRQWGSITPGHPEYGLTPGVETTTGPLGQGFANAVGMALAYSFLSYKFNKEDIKILNNKIYAIAGDGDMMEGISHEAASFAGHNKLNNLIVFYDNNKITIDGKLDLAMSENVSKRFEAYGWEVLHVKDVNDLDELELNILKAQKSDRPVLIVTNTHIGFGSPNKQDTASVHGSPLGEEEVKLTKKNLGWPEDKTFFIPGEVREHFEAVKINGKGYEKEWEENWETYKEKYPEDALLFENIFKGDFGTDWINSLPEFKDYNEKLATRAASGKVLNAIAKNLPTLFGGSADLAPSNNTYLKDYPDFSANNRAGRNLHFGIREHAMAGILNGMALYGGVIPYGGTFLVFSDYLRPSIRIAGLSKIKPIYVFTHDSIGLGEDGPTHQPVEHLAALRAIPKFVVIRPADANETVTAWKYALQHKGGPVAIILTRQKLPVIDRTKFSSADNLEKGAYILKNAAEVPDVLLIATGSEVHLALNAAELLEKEKDIKVNVVSMPSWELFEMQSEEYKNTVIPQNVKVKISIEAAVGLGWERYTGNRNAIISIEKYGASAPAGILFEKYGFTVEHVLSKVDELLQG